MKEVPHSHEQDAQRRLHEVSQKSDIALNQHDLDSAVELCNEAISLSQPNSLDMATFLNRRGIAESMQGDHEGSQQSFTHALVVAEKLGDPLTQGDVMRDVAFSLIRKREGRTPEDINMAEQIIAQAKELHKKDDNRLAALEGAQGRVYFARSLDAKSDDERIELLEESLRRHKAASQLWTRDLETSNPQWMFNNLRPLMRVYDALGETKNARKIAEKIRGLNEAFGTPDIAREVKEFLATNSLKKVTSNMSGPHVETVKVKDGLL